MSVVCGRDFYTVVIEDDSMATVASETGRGIVTYMLPVEAFVNGIKNLID